MVFLKLLYICWASIAGSSVAWQRSYSSISKSTKFLNSLNPIKIYGSLHQPSKQKQMLQDLAGQGGIILFLNKNSSLYAIEGSEKLTNYLTMLSKRDYLKYLVNLKTTSKSKTPLKSHYQELLKLGWKDYELCLLESWKDQEKINIQERLAYYHTKYQPRLNLVRYVALADGKIEAVYQRNNFKTQEQMLATSQKKAILKPLLTYRLDSTSPLSKWQGKVYLLIREIPAPVKVKTRKTWTLSETTRLKQSLAQQKRTKHPKPGLAVQVQDLVANKTTVYSSYREAARALTITKPPISKGDFRLNLFGCWVPWSWYVSPSLSWV